mgnify:CR=1 FL=1
MEKIKNNVDKLVNQKVQSLQKKVEDLKNRLEKKDEKIEEQEEKKPNTVKEKLRQKFEEAKKYDPDQLSSLQKQLFDSLGEDPEMIPAFYRDQDLQEYDQFLSSDVETQYKRARALEMKNNNYEDEEIRETIDNELDEKTEDELKQHIDPFVKNVKKAKKEKIQNIVDEHKNIKNQNDQKQSQQLDKQREQAAQEVQNVDDFFGFNIPDTHKKNIQDKIKDGTIDQELSNASGEQKAKAYLAMQYYDKIQEQISNTLKKKGIESKQAGIQQMLKHIHNISPEGSGGNIEGNTQNQGNVKQTENNRPGWSNSELGL